MNQDSDPQPGQGSGVEVDASQGQEAGARRMTTPPPLPDLNEPLPSEDDSDKEAKENLSFAPNESTGFEGVVRPRLLVSGHGSSSVLGTGNDASGFSTERARNLRLAASAGTYVFPNPHCFSHNSSGPPSRNVVPSYRSAFLLGSSSSGLNVAEEFRLAVSKIASPVILGPVDGHDSPPERQISNQELPEQPPLEIDNDEPLDDGFDVPMSEEEILTGILVHKHEPEKCCICLEEYVQGEEIGTLRCFHRFHVDCIKEWLRRKNICPICKLTAVF